MEKVKTNLMRVKSAYLISYVVIIPMISWLASGRFSLLLWGICLPVGIGHFLYFMRVQLPQCKDVCFFYDGITITSISRGQTVFIAWEHLKFETKTAIFPIYKPILLTSKIDSNVQEYISVDWFCNESFLELANKYCPESSEFKKIIFDRAR